MLNDYKELIDIRQNENGDMAVSARDIYKALEVKTRFSLWLKSHNDILNEDNTQEIETIILVNNGAKRKVKDFLVSINAALALINKSKLYNNDKVYKELLKKAQKRKEVLYFKGKTKEQEFGKMLKTLTDLSWFEQYSVDSGKYFIDFYAKAGLVVEYDEDFHKYQNEKDDKRIEDILNILAEENLKEDGERFKPAVIRVKEGEELEGIKRILDYIKINDMEETLVKQPKVEYEASFPDRKKQKSIQELFGGQN